MTKNQFKKLKVGDSVTLAVDRHDYSCGHSTPDGRIYVPAGSVGIIGAVKVPNVTGKEGYFVCVDFDADSLQLEDCKGHPAEHWHKIRPAKWRVAAYADELI